MTPYKSIIRAVDNIFQLLEEELHYPFRNRPFVYKTSYKLIRKINKFKTNDTMNINIDTTEIKSIIILINNTCYNLIKKIYIGSVEHGNMMQYLEKMHNRYNVYRQLFVHFAIYTWFYHTKPSIKYKSQIKAMVYVMHTTFQDIRKLAI